jgi:hypothetical protein
LKNRYPFLASWKEQGFDKFPSIPVSAIIEFYKKRFFDFLRRDGRSPLKEILLENRPENGAIIDAANELLDRDAKKWMFRVAEKMMIAETWALGRLSAEARHRVINGEDREIVLRDLGRKILPQTKGGASIFTLDQKKTLKVLYHELQECIKEIRRQLDIPLKESGYYLGQNKPEDIEHFCPGIDNLFVEEELSFLIKNPSIADTAAEIIVRRINQCIPTNLTKPRALQNFLNSIPLFFTE